MKKPRRKVPKRTREPRYTHRDATGMRWRFVGGRAVSELRDKTLRDCGLPIS